MTELLVNKIKGVISSKRHLVAYIISGVSALVVDYTTFVILYYAFHAPIVIAAPIGLTAGLIISFMLNKLWTFKDQVRVGKKQTAIQVALYMALFLLNNLFTVYFIRILLVAGISAAIGKIVTTGVITLWNYILYKNVIFQNRKAIV